MKIRNLVPILFLFITAGHAQILCKGVLLDSTTKQPVEFANIGIPNKGIGTVTDEKGGFSFKVPDSLADLKTKISIIGYKTKTVAVRALQKNGTVLLAQSAVALNEVSVSAKKLKVKMLGNNTRTKGVSGGFMSASLGSELAVRINVKKPKTQLRKFFVNINDSPVEKPVFRFNVYKVANGMPGENILTQNIIVEPKEKTGLIEVDLMPYNIYVDDDVFIAIEWVKDLGSGHTIMFSAKLVGSPTWYKTASQDKWEKTVVGLGLHVEAAY